MNNGSETEPATDTADSQTTTPSPFVFDDVGILILIYNF